MQDSTPPRTHPWALYRTGHLFQWGSNDSANVGADSPSDLENHPQVSAWLSGVSPKDSSGADESSNKGSSGADESPNKGSSGADESSNKGSSGKKE